MDVCCSAHVQKRTKTHKLVDITKEIIDKKLCEPCNSKNKSINATYICDDCDENLCEACKKFHMLQKQNKSHKLRNLVQQLFRFIHLLSNNWCQIVRHFMGC
jgi:flagellar biosynthesis component FlhA